MQTGNHWKDHRKKKKEKKKNFDLICFGHGITKRPIDTQKKNQNWFRLRCHDHNFSCQEIRSATLALMGMTRLHPTDEDNISDEGSILDEVIWNNEESSHH